LSAKGTAEIYYHRMVRGYLACNQVDSARQIVDVMEDAVRNSRLPQAWLSIVLARKVDILLFEGNLASAEDVFAELLPVDYEHITYQDEEFHLTLARLWVLQGKFQQASKLLHILEINTSQNGRQSHLIEILTLQFLIANKQNRAEDAQEVLLSALSIAEPEGFIRVFIEGGKMVRYGLVQISATRKHSAYVHQIIEAFNGDQKNIAEIETHFGGVVESLSARELQVLFLLRTHLSQQEIAEELCVSVNTIRFHTKNIYSKLGVHDRSSAVDKAVKQGLI
jgi:LuxR family maltose regulon positive regulatory protein